MKPNPSKLDTLLDSSILLGFSKVGSGLRRLPAVSTSMSGKRAVITGSTGGIGYAVEYFADAKAGSGRVGLGLGGGFGFAGAGLRLELHRHLLS